MKRLLNNCNQTTTDALLSVVLNIHAHVASDTFSKPFFPLFVSCTKKQNKTKNVATDSYKRSYVSAPVSGLLFGHLI